MNEGRRVNIISIRDRGASFQLMVEPPDGGGSALLCKACRAGWLRWAGARWSNPIPTL